MSLGHYLKGTAFHSVALVTCLRSGPTWPVTPGLTWGISRLLVTWLVTPQP